MNKTNEYSLTDEPRMLRDRLVLVKSSHDKENPYCMIRKDSLQNSQLSYEARGMLAFLLSQKEGKKIKPKDLIVEGICGRDKVYSILSELEMANHLKRPEKYQDEKGHWQWKGDWEIYEEPYPEKPNTVQPNTVNTEIKDQNTKNENTKRILADAIASADNELKSDPKSDTADIPTSPKESSSRKDGDQRVPVERMTPMKNAIAAAFGWNWKTMTKSEIGMIQATARQLCLAGREPKDVRIIYAYCIERKFENFKPTALAAWATEALKQKHEEGVPAGWTRYDNGDVIPTPKPWDGKLPGALDGFIDVNGKMIFVGAH